MTEVSRQQTDPNLPEVIADFIISCRGKGHYLPYKDYSLIEKWIKLAPNENALMLVLSELVPDFIEKSKLKSAHPCSLAGLDRKVVNQLRSMAMRASEF